jgi:hypothetical protein
MPPERSRQLVYELEAFYRSHPMRQKDLANELGLKPQQLSEILALRNRPTGEQILTIQDFLKDNDPMSSTPVFDPARTRQKTQPDDEEIVLGSDGQPKTLTDAKELLIRTQKDISGLQNEVTRLRAAVAQATSPPSTLPKPSSAPAPDTRPTPPPAAVTTERAKSQLANTRTEDLLNAVKLARSEGNLEAVGAIQAELRARSVTASLSDKRPEKPPVRLPAAANTPASQRTVFDNTSMEGLREMLVSEKDPVRRMTIFREIKKREREG